MQVNDEIVNQMLRNLPQDQQQIMAGILKNEIAYEVICNTQDQFADVEVQVLDEHDQPVVYKSGEKKGQVKYKTEKQLVQRGTKGATIAYITTDGQIIPTTAEDGTMWLRATRVRTDGEYGFECWCGADTRIAPNELGILRADGSQPSKEDLYKMAENLQKKPPKYVTIMGERVVDGFVIRDVRK